MQRGKSGAGNKSRQDQMIQITIKAARFIFPAAVAAVICLLRPSSGFRKEKSWTVLSTSCFPRVGDPRTPAVDLA
jgi:hypothetical protein